MKFNVELTEVYEDGALVIVEGDDWIVAIPFTLSDNKATIDVDELLATPEDTPISDIPASPLTSPQPLR